MEFENDKNVTFNCKARTDPETKIFYKWKYNDQDVNSGNIKTNQEELFLDVDELQANNIHFIGKWTCEATNTFSTDKAHAYLRQKSGRYLDFSSSILDLSQAALFLNFSRIKLFNF